MSTYVGYVCESHNPFIESDYWYNHGEKRLIEVLHHRELIISALDHLELITEPLEVSWLRTHRYCKVRVINEYGDYYDDSGDEIEKDKS